MAGAMRAPFTRAMLRWLMQSKRRRLSISSSKNSMRSASAALAGNTSTIAPRMAHWPRPSTMGTRSYPLRMSASMSRSGGKRPPSESSITALRKRAHGAQRSKSASTLAHSTRTRPAASPSSTLRRCHALSRLMAARLNCMSRAGSTAQPPPVSRSTSCAWRWAISSVGATSSTGRPVACESAAARNGRSPSAISYSAVQPSCATRSSSRFQAGRLW